MMNWLGFLKMRLLLKTSWRAALACVLLWMGVIANGHSASGEGQMSVTYLDEKKYADVRKLIEEDGLIERLVGFMNEHILLTEDVSIVVGGDDGPVFYPGESLILLPYFFVEDSIAMFEDAGEERRDAELFSLDVLEHIFFHELGHALVAQLAIPFTGKEEDAVDELAGLMVIATNQNASEVMLSAADSFSLYDMNTKKLTEQDYSGEHSLDIQRFYSIVCMIFGHRPDEYESLVEDLDFEDHRIYQCEEDFPRQVRNWLILLGPHLAKPEAFKTLFTEGLGDGS